MSFQPQLSQEDLAQMIDREGLDKEFESLHKQGQWYRADESQTAVEHLRFGGQIRLASGALTDFGLLPPLHPHNPDGLTADVITEGGLYRGVTADEKRIRRDNGGELQRWNGAFWEKYGYGDMEECLVSRCTSTYRVPVSTPFPNALPPGGLEKMLDEAASPSLKFKRGDRVTKVSGGCWTGLVVGNYSTKLTPEGYAVESENEPGSVQIYPEKALRLAPTPEQSSAVQSGTPLVYTICPHCNRENEVPLDGLGYSNCSNCGKRIDCWLRLSSELTAALSQRDEARRLLGEAKEVLSDLSRYVSAGAYPDGPCLKDEDLDAVNSTLKQITEYLK